MENRSGDEITSTTGDGAKNSITGKENRQDVTENQGSNIVNNYIDRNNPDRAARRQSITLRLTTMSANVRSPGLKV
jgi:hypothetical protein